MKDVFLKVIALSVTLLTVSSMTACNIFPDKTLEYVNAQVAPSVVLENGQEYPNSERYKIPDVNETGVNDATVVLVDGKFVTPKPPKVVVDDFVKQAAGTDIVWSDVVYLQEDGNAQPVVVIAAQYEAAWVRLLSVLPATNIDIKDKNFTSGEVLVDLPSRYKEGEYQLNLERGANGALLVLKQDEKLAEAELAQKVLADIARAIVR